MAARKKPAQPKAVPVDTICSVCGLSWTDHGADPTTDDCIRLLKAELANNKTIIREPYRVEPYRWPYREPIWYWSGEEGLMKKEHTEYTPKYLKTTCNEISISASV